MKKLYALSLLVLALVGCSKPAPEPEPAEQVIGSYTVNKLTQSVKYATSPSELSQSYALPFKGSNGDEISMVIDIAKKSANVLSAVLVQTTKIAATGKSEISRDPLDDIELKKADGSPAGQFDMYVTGVKAGTVGNNTFSYEESGTDKDTDGKTYTYKTTITATKK